MIRPVSNIRKIWISGLRIQFQHNQFQHYQFSITSFSITSSSITSSALLVSALPVSAFKFFRRSMKRTQINRQTKKIFSLLILSLKMNMFVMLQLMENTPGKWKCVTMVQWKTRVSTVKARDTNQLDFQFWYCKFYKINIDIAQAIFCPRF